MILPRRPRHSESVRLGLGIAEDLGEDEDSLRDVANEMEIEDGTIWVYGVGEDGVMATDFGIKNLIELIRFYKEKTNCSGVEISNALRLRSTPDGYRKICLQ